MLFQVLAAARRGFQASGLELNPWLVWFSRYQAWRAGLRRSTSFYMSDLWKVSWLGEVALGSQGAKNRRIQLSFKSFLCC